MGKDEEGVRVEVLSTGDGWVVAKMFQGNTLEGETEIARIRQAMLESEEQRDRFLQLLNTGMVLALKDAGHDEISVRVFRGSTGGH